MRFNEVGELIDHTERRQIALALCIAPGEQAMAAKYDAIARRLLLNRPLHHHGELEPRTLPWHPDQLMSIGAIELLHLLAPVGRGRQRDGTVRVEMIDMRIRKKAMQWSIDGSRNWIDAKSAERVELHHLIFAVGTAIELLQSQKFLHVEGGKASPLDAPQITAAALHP